jgi:SIR2-like domain
MPIVEKWVPIAELMLEGKIVPFLGAGASSYHVDHGATCNADHRGPPTGRKLLDIIAAEAELDIQCKACAEPSYNLAQVASYYARVKHSRRQLDSKIAKLTGNRAYRPNALHRLLARIALHQPMLLITTNYDTLLEDAFDLAGAPYEVVATAADLLAYGSAYESVTDQNSVDLERLSVGAEAGMVYHRLGESTEFTPVPPNSILAELKGRSLIYKVHGSVAAATGDWRGGYLIAEEDYVRFLGRMDQAHICPFAIRNRLRRTTGNGRQKSLLHSLLFLGYSLGDWNLRVLLDGLGVGQGGPDERHYAILRETNEVAKQLLEKRNIAVRIADLTVLVKELDETLDCLGLGGDTGAAAAD